MIAKHQKAMMALPALLLFVMTGCTASHGDPAEALKKANQLLVEGSASEAAELLIQTLGESPDHAPAWDLLTYAFVRMEQFEAASATGERAVALGPDTASARFNAGLATARRRAYPRAIAHLEAAARLNQKLSDPSYLLGAALEAAAQPEEALNTYRNAVSVFPGDQDLERALAAAMGDLTMDGKTEQISVKGNVVTVMDGASGAKLLEWTENGADKGSVLIARAVDLGGNVPALLVSGRASATAFHWSQNELEKLDTMTGTPNYSPVDRAVVTAMTGTDRSTFRYWRMVDGKLTVVKMHEEPFKQPVTKPLSLVELFIATSTGQQAAYSSPALWNEVISKWGSTGAEQLRAAFLLPQLDGTYQLRLEVDGKTVATADAQVEQFQIQRLKWK